MTAAKRGAQANLTPTQLASLKSQSLIALLHEFRCQQCKEYQDRLYSLLTLCGEGS